MCDTFVALGSATADGAVLFGKNSDREPNEAQAVCFFPAQDYPDGSQVRCTYRSVPQVAHTNAVLLSKPFWMWGAEMGVNEHGVVIGNEAVFTRVPYQRDASLTGMDLLRLALERAATARAALDVITDLLAAFGQGGNCGFTHPFYYHNSFLLADAHEAWVLETAGEHWAAERVRDFRSISNALTIGKAWDLASPHLVTHAVQQGWCKGPQDFDFARCYSDVLYTRLSDAGKRQVCTTQLLRQAKGKMDTAAAFAIIRAHGADADLAWSPDHGFLGAEVCMHAGAGPVRNSQSVGSMVVHLGADVPLAWVTSASAPCTAVFKPVWLDAGLPVETASLQGTFDPACRWWQHERLHRAILQDFSQRLSLITADRDRMEANFLDEALTCRDQPSAERQAFTARCFAAVAAEEERWYQQVAALPVKRKPAFYHAAAWRKFDRQALMPK